MSSYEAPELKLIGTVEAFTAGTSNGDFLDRDFPVSTPRGDLTFS